MAEQVSEETIWVVTDDVPQIAVPDDYSIKRGSEDIGGGFSSPKTPAEIAATKGVQVSVEKLEREMTGFLQVIGRIFSCAEQQAQQQPGLQLDEIALAIEISASGQVKLIGSGIEAAGKGAITLKFKRLKSN